MSSRASFHKQSQQGLALIQVLLLVAMLSILLLLMVATTQQQQRQVLAMQAQLDEHFDLYTQSNDLVFALLTESWQPSRDPAAMGPLQQSRPGWQQHWNFYAHEFSYGNYRARITNLNSLVNIRGSGYGMAELLRFLGQSEARAEQLAQAVREWQMPSQAIGVQLPSEQTQSQVALPLQHAYELAFMPGWDADLAQQVAPYISTFGSRMLNEAYMPDNMLQMMVSASQAAIIAQLRAEGSFNRQQFSAITGLVEDEFRSFFVGPDFRIEIWHQDNPVLVRVLELRVEPYLRDPITVRYQGWGY